MLALMGIFLVLGCVTRLRGIVEGRTMRCQPLTDDQVYIWTKNKQHCLLCGEVADTGHPLCGACQDELPWLGGHCRTCAVPLPASGLICGACQKRPPAFDRVEAAWRYAFPVDSLITRFKHQAR